MDKLAQGEFHHVEVHLQDVHFRDFYFGIGLVISAQEVPFSNIK
jgi:hypothetical protein